MLGVIFSFLLISASDGLQLKVPDSPVTCSNEGVECEYDENNLIDAVMNVPTLEECRQICLDRDYCSYTTYFYDSASPVPSFCLLFKTCETTNTCSDCMSENMGCFKMCGSNVVGDLRENVQDIIPNIESEMDCKQLCLNNTSCSYYTFFFNNNTQFHKFCFLQTELLPPIESCEACITGPVNCQNACYLKMNGEFYQSLMLTSSTNEIKVEGFGKCGLKFLVVGGGGDENEANGGAGSGYLHYGSVEVVSGTSIDAKVGQSKQSSVLTFSTGETITAEAGESGAGSRGGNGYCGGGSEGGNKGGNGGTDGGDGDGGSYGGSGTGEDISAYTFSAWTLSPGAGGRDNEHSGGGGGGGGVVISGAGPDGSDHQGEGYGGGASGYSDPDGLQGVILVEIDGVN